MSVASLRFETYPNDTENDRVMQVYINDIPMAQYMRTFDLHIGTDGLGVATVEFIVKPDMPESIMATIKGTLSDPLGLLEVE